MGYSAQQNSDGSFQGGAWPVAGYLPNAPTDGFYRFRVNQSDTNTNFDLYVWLISGNFTTKPPDPPQDANPPPVPGSGGGGADCTLNVQVQNKSAQGTAASYFYVYLYGKSVAGKTCNLGGNCSFTNISSGAYSLHLVGTLQTTTGSTISVNQTVNTTLNQGETQTLTITIDDTGTVTNAAAGSNTASNPNAQPSWLQTAFQNLFVPDQAHLDEVHNDLNAILGWGPFALLSQMAQLTGAAVVDQNKVITLAMPSPTWIPDGGPQSNPGYPSALGGHWDVTSNYAPLGFQGLLNAPLWPLFRLLEGGSVWITFIFGMAHKFMPRQSF